MKKNDWRAANIPITGVQVVETGPDRQHWYQRMQPSGIQARIIGLIVLVMLPLLLLLAWIYYQHYTIRSQDAQQTELEVARGIATTFVTYVEGVHQKNYAIGQAINSSMRDDHPQITDLLTRTADQSPAVRNINWVQPDGVVIASSLPALVGRNLAVRPYFQAVVSGADWYIGDLTNQGIATNAPTLAIATAIRDDSGVLQGVVVTALEPDRLGEITLTQQRPGGGAFAIFDRTGKIIYRSVGPMLTWEQRTSWGNSDWLLQEALSSGVEQVGIGYLDMTGEEWVSARVPVEKIGYIVGAGRPAAVAFEPVVGSLVREGLLALLIWLMALVFAILIARAISRPIHLLEHDAQAMGTGRLEVREDPQAPAEVRSLRRTVEAMASALIQRAEALTESEARFRVLFHNRHSPMLLIDPATGQIVEANRAACEYYGWSQEQLLEMKISDINQLRPDQIQNEMRQAQDTGTSKLFHFRHRLASGEIRDVEVSSGPIHINGQEYLFSIIHDITERHMAEREMRERNEGLALLSEAAQELLTGSDPTRLMERIYPRLAELLDLDTYFHYTLSSSGEYLELAGYAEVPGKPAPEQRLDLGQAVCGRAAQQRKAAIIDDVQHSEKPETHMIRALGMTAYACHPLIVDSELIGTLSFGSRKRTSFNPHQIHLMRTIANLLAAAMNRRKAEAKLQIYARKLEESNSELQSFAFIASHDLQEPLRKVESFGNLMMKDSAKMEEHQRDYLERMRQAAGRMRRMVMDLLELSRVSTQGRPFEPVNLDQTVREVLSDLEMQIHQTRGNVVVENLPVIEADPTQMHQLMQNLIGNALKYHRPGIAPQVSITHQKGVANIVEVRVTDNGIGFDPGLTSRVFQPFQRLVGRSEYEGTGIGLAICRKIVERHQGSITAESVPGEGTVFIVRLPVTHMNGNG